jgi:magnesium-protoporphyrin IX monomethyl ester (oxidative) cyclase
LKPQDFYGLTYPFDPESVFNLAYHFVDRNADTDRIDDWLDRFNTSIAQRTRRWLGSDDQPQARLCFAGDETEWAVYDSRSGMESETTISELDKQVLNSLSTPRSLAQLCDDFGNEAEAALKRFRDHDWIFTENERFLSLIT